MFLMVFLPKTKINEFRSMHSLKCILLILYLEKSWSTLLGNKIIELSVFDFDFSETTKNSVVHESPLPGDFVVPADIVSRLETFIHRGSECRQCDYKFPISAPLTLENRLMDLAMEGIRYQFQIQISLTEFTTIVPERNAPCLIDSQRIKMQLVQKFQRLWSELHSKFELSTRSGILSLLRIIQCHNDKTFDPWSLLAKSTVPLTAKKQSYSVFFM
jgi:hypothetical protein